MLESLRGKNKSLGSIWYWNPDPTKGNDANDGTTPGTAVATFAHAQELATAGAGDLLFALATSSITTTGETIDIYKASLKLRGPGYPFHIIPLTPGSPTITVSADNAEVSGFYVTTAGAGTDNGITVTGDSVLIQDMWIQNASGNGIDISLSARTNINTCAIENCTGKGINVGATTTLSTISKCIITGNADGVNIDGSGILDNVLENNLIYNHTGYGINIAAGPLRTHISSGHTFSKNTLGDTNYPDGYDTYVEPGAGELDATQVANAVWDAAIGSHVGEGTAGKTLKDAKTKATLASLK